LVSGIAFPFIIEYNLIEPFKTNAKNIRELRGILKEFLKNSKDKESVYNKLINEYGIEEHLALDDIISLLLAGHDTTSHAIVSAVYFLKKYPEISKKLKTSLKDSGFSKDSDFENEGTKEILNNLDYLSFVAKETLRIDPPAFASITYTPSEEISICGVNIKKGQQIQIGILALHYHQLYWQEPMKFIPERFDPESDYYYKPGNKKETRDPTCFIPFSYGMRKCPGQILAMMELKVLIAKFILSVDYDIDQQQLENEYARFAMLSNFKLKLKFNKKVSE